MSTLHEIKRYATGQRIAITASFAKTVAGKSKPGKPVVAASQVQLDRRRKDALEILTHLKHELKCGASEVFDLLVDHSGDVKLSYHFLNSLCRTAGEEPRDYGIVSRIGESQPDAWQDDDIASKFEDVTGGLIVSAGVEAKMFGGDIKGMPLQTLALSIYNSFNKNGLGNINQTADLKGDDAHWKATIRNPEAVVPGADGIEIKCKQELGSAGLPESFEIELRITFPKGPAKWFTVSESSASQLPEPKRTMGAFLYANVENVAKFLRGYASKHSPKPATARIAASVGGRVLPNGSIAVAAKTTGLKPLTDWATFGMSANWDRNNKPASYRLVLPHGTGNNPPYINIAEMDNGKWFQVSFWAITEVPGFEATRAHSHAWLKQDGSDYDIGGLPGSVKFASAAKAYAAIKALWKRYTGKQVTASGIASVADIAAALKSEDYRNVSTRLHYAAQAFQDEIDPSAWHTDRKNFAFEASVTNGLDKKPQSVKFFLQFLLDGKRWVTELEIVGTHAFVGTQIGEPGKALGPANTKQFTMQADDLGKGFLNNILAYMRTACRRAGLGKTVTANEEAWKQIGKFGKWIVETSGTRYFVKGDYASDFARVENGTVRCNLKLPKAVSDCILKHEAKKSGKKVTAGDKLEAAVVINTKTDLSVDTDAVFAYIHGMDSQVKITKAQTPRGLAFHALFASETDISGFGTELGRYCSVHNGVEAVKAVIAGLQESVKTGKPFYINERSLSDNYVAETISRKTRDAFPDCDDD